MLTPLQRKISTTNWRNSPTVYLAGPMKGMNFQDAVSWRQEVELHMEAFGIKSFNPLRNCDHLTGVTKIKNTYESNPRTSRRGVFMHGKFAIMKSDAILANFLFSEEASIGTSFELAWAHMAHKPIVSVIDPSNIHNHPFILEASDFISSNLNSAVDILVELLK